MNKSAFIAIIGRPNVGKSSLMNKMLGQKIAIVSDKPQTTRTRIMGVLTNKETQLVFIDTPGFHKPKNVLGENMIKAVNDGLSDVEAVLFVVDGCPKFDILTEGIPDAEKALIEKLKQRNVKTVLAINKIDLIKDKSDILKLINIYTSAYDFEAVVPISAKTGNGTDILMSELSKYAVESVHFFSADDVTDQPEKVMVAEMIREKLLRSLSKEVPHGIAVDIERFFERDTRNGDPILEIDATVICEKESHKGIVIGKGGAMLKKIGIRARKDIEEFFGIQASLNLRVKVKEDWRNRQGLIHTFGLD